MFILAKNKQYKIGMIISFINWTTKATLYLFCLFCLFTSQVNNYGHGGTVSSPNHTVFLGRLEQAVNQYFMHILSLVTDNNSSWIIKRNDEIESRNYFMINLHVSMGPGQDLLSDSHLLPDTLPTALGGPVSHVSNKLKSNKETTKRTRSSSDFDIHK